MSAKKFSAYDRNRLENAVSIEPVLGAAQRQLKLDTNQKKEFWWDCWKKDLVDHIRTLWESPDGRDILETDYQWSDMELLEPEEVGHGKVGLTLRFHYWDNAGAVPYSSRLVKIGPNHLMRAEIIRHVQRVIQAEAEYRAADHIAKLFLQYTNTPGQFMRVWPSAVPLLTGSMQAVIAKAQRGSNLSPKLKDIWPEDKWVWMLKEKVTPLLAKAKLIRASGRHEVTPTLTVSTSWSDVPEGNLWTRRAEQWDQDYEAAVEARTREFFNVLS